MPLKPCSLQIGHLFLGGSPLLLTTDQTEESPWMNSDKPNSWIVSLSATRSSGVIRGHIYLFIQIDVPDGRACVLVQFVLPTASPRGFP